MFVIPTSDSGLAAPLEFRPAFAPDRQDKRPIAMSLNNIPPGKNAPEEFNVIIEIPMNADPIKYEVDKESGALFVDRFMTTAMHYPCNYGYIPRTLSDDELGL